MAGNTLGPRSYFVYPSDSGVNYNILTDDDNGLAGGLVKATAGNPRKPTGMKLRGVYVEGTVGGNLVRKFIACSPTAAIYNTDISTAVTIDGTNFLTTGRKGEQLSFPKFDPAP